jgi:hypothetical protein
MTVSPRDSAFQTAVALELLEARRASPVPDLYALVEEVGDMARALSQYREDRIAWPEVVAEAVQLAVMAQRVAVEGEPPVRDFAADSRGGTRPEEAADLPPWAISFWAISGSAGGEEADYAVQRLEIGADGVRPTPEIQLAASLDEARRLIPSGLRRFSRHPLDDPAVVEVWM